jgi:hypothetical protein
LHRAVYALRHTRTADLAARIVRTYLEERLDVSGNALTPVETAALLLQRKVPEDAADACRNLLAQLDEAMYRPDASRPLQEILGSLHDLLPRLDTALDAPAPKTEDLP